MSPDDQNEKDDSDKKVLVRFKFKDEKNHIKN